MRALDGVYHFALLHPEERINAENSSEHTGGWMKKRRGSAVISEMLDKTVQLNADKNVCIRLVCS